MDLAGEATGGALVELQQKSTAACQAKKFSAGNLAHPEKWENGEICLEKRAARLRALQAAGLPGLAFDLLAKPQDLLAPMCLRSIRIEDCRPLENVLKHLKGLPSQLH